MLQTTIGNPSSIKQHVIVKLTNKIDSEGYEVKEGFSIEDINPENKPGLPKFSVLLKATYFSETVQPEQTVDIYSLEINMDKLINYLLPLKKGDNKINIMIQSRPEITTDYLVYFFLLSKTQKSFNFKLFMKSAEEMLFLKNIEYAIEKVKSIASNKTIDCKEVLKVSFEADMLDIYEEAVVKKTVKVKKSLEGKRVVIVDTHNFYYRAYFGMPEMNNTAGFPTSVIKGLMTYLKSFINESPDYILFASEDKNGVKNGVRFKMYDQYKANREKTPEDLVVQIKKAEELLEKMGFPIISKSGFEADDIVGSYSKLFSDLGAEVVIHTTDKDMYQLISDKVKIYNPMKNIMIGESECIEKFGVGPDKVVYSLALAGDTSDNVPGVKGIGPKKSASLLSQYGTIQGIYENMEDIPGAAKKNLVENKENAFISYELVKIFDFLATDVEIRNYIFSSFNFFAGIEEDLKELEITV